MLSASLNKTFPSFLPDDGEGGHELGAAQIISSVKQTLITINIDYLDCVCIVGHLALSIK